MFNRHGVMVWYAGVISLCRCAWFLRAAGEGRWSLYWQWWWWWRCTVSGSVLPLSPRQQVVREIVALRLGNRIVFSRWLEGLEFNIVYNSFGDIVFAVDKTIDTSCSLFLEN